MVKVSKFHEWTLCFLTPSQQSILSQFSHKLNATADASEEAKDAAALEELDNDVSDLEENATESLNDEIENGFDLSVVESDAAIVDKIAAEAKVFALPALSRTEVNLGQFAVTKVSHIP